MKNFFIILFLLTSLNLISQEYTIIYIDNSNSINNAGELISQVNNTINQVDSNLILIYADKNTPIISKNKFDISEIINQESYKRRNRPSVNKAIDLVANEIISFVDLNQGDLLVDRLNLYFYFDAYNFQIRKYYTNLILKILNVTRLKKSSEINANCFVYINLDNSKNVSSEELFQTKFANIKINEY